ncbi:MAG: radical SAM protein [Deltaproteobacteria bacterium]|nr:radical SAM protein [Deltaproteobacteria bacterium]
MTIRAGRQSGFRILLESLAARQETPVAAMLQLTARCNLRCQHCYQVERRKRELTTAQWFSTLDELHDAGVLFLTLSGGEPLLRPDFFDICRRARELRFALQLKTNALLIDRRAADRLASLALLDVQMSLYSTQSKVHDSITGLRGSHRRLMSAARMLVRRNVKVSMMTPIMVVNVGEIDDLVSLADREGFDWSMDPHLNVCEDGGCTPLSLRTSDEQLEEIFSNPKLVDARAVRRLARERRPADRVCNAGRVSCCITAEGEVMPCPLLQVSFGNVLNRPFARIWTSSRKRARIDALTWNDLPGCRDCNLMPWCVRCHGAALIEDGDMKGPSRIACSAAAARRRAVTRKRASRG